LLTGSTSGSQGQGRQSLGHNSHEVKIGDKFNLFANVPQQQQDYLCLDLFAEGRAGSSSVLLRFLVISLTVTWFLRNLRAKFGFKDF